MSGVNQLPSNFSYGTDITQQLLTSRAATIDLSDSGQFPTATNDTVRIEYVARLPMMLVLQCPCQKSTPFLLHVTHGEGPTAQLYMTFIGQ